MSQRVKRLTPYVLTLKELKPKQRKQLVGFCSGEQLRAFEELALNIVKNTTPLSDDQIEVCRKWKKPLKQLAQRKHSIKAKRALLQKGGFLGAILPILASVLGSVIGSS
jgi:NAD dependent epimerase/dehydratase family enzyme